MQRLPLHQTRAGGTAVRSGGDGEALWIGFTMKLHAHFLIGLEAEMGGGAEHPFNGTEFPRDESGYFLQVAALDHDEKVITSAHEIAAYDFREAGDSLGQFVKSALALRSNPYLDHGGYALGVHFIGIHYDLIAPDDILIFQFLDSRRYFRLG